MKVPSTYKILKAKAFNEDVDKTWIDWAVEMIEAGYSSENLYILAGIRPLYNQFELQDLTSKVFQDLNLNFRDKDSVLRDYVYYLISESVNHPETYGETLCELKDFYENLDADQYKDFWLLYLAKDTLELEEEQSYWAGATKGNIDHVIENEFRSRLSKYENEKK